MPTKKNRRSNVYGYPNPQSTLQQEPIVQPRDPSAQDSAEPGTIWVNSLSESFFINCGSANGVNAWTATTGGAETLTALTVNPGNIIVTAGDVTIAAGDLDMDPASHATLGLLAAGNTALAGTLNVTGAATFGSTVDITGAVTLDSDLDVAGDVTVTGDFDLTSVDAISFTSSSNTNPAISFTTAGGAAETIRILSTQGTSITSVSLESTLGGITLDAGKASINAINLLTSGAGGISMDYGTAGMAIDGNGAFSLTTATGAIGISTDATATAINIGTGAASVKTISIGGTGANVIRIGNTQTGGSVAIGTAMTTGTVSIGGTGLQTGTVSIAPGTGAQTVNIATGGTGTKTINIGTGAINNDITMGNSVGSTSIAINAGTGGLIMTSEGEGLISSSGGDFEINASTSNVFLSGATGAFIDVDANGIIDIGVDAGAKDITIGNTTPGTTLVLETAAGTNVVATNGLSVLTAGRGLSLPGGLLVLAGAGSPNAAVSAPTGSFYLRSNPAGADSRLYVKTGEDATSWVNVTCAE